MHLCGDGKMDEQMKLVTVRGATGSEKAVALVYQDGDTVYVCAPSKYEAVGSGDSDTPVIGFPIKDVRFTA